MAKKKKRRLKKRHPGKVVVEIENVEVDSGNANDAHPDKMLGDIPNLLQTDNLPVPFMAIASGLASKHNHQRFARLAR